VDQDIDCIYGGTENITTGAYAVTHFVDFYTNFTLWKWTGRVERAHMIFSHDDWEAAGSRA